MCVCIHGQGERKENSEGKNSYPQQTQTPCHKGVKEKTDPSQRQVCEGGWGVEMSVEVSVVDVVSVHLNTCNKPRL